MRRSVLPTRVVTMGVMAAAIVLASATAVYAQSGSVGSQTWSGYVANNGSDCQFLSENLQSGQGATLQPGWPRMDSRATVDGPAGCSNKSFQAAPGTLDVRQDLIAWDTAFYRSYPCNSGPWITNAGWSHEVSTGYGWLSGYQPPCGNTWYYQDAASYWLTGGVWHGSWHSTGWLYVWSTF